MTRPRHILLFFVDGLGIGEADPRRNPCAVEGISHLAVYRDNGGLVVRDPQVVALPVDPLLGVSGLPQSATGQTALLSGINAPGLLGRHLCGFPNAPLREILRHHSLLKQARALGHRAGFINAYRDLFFSLPETLRWRLSATTVSNLAAGLPFRTIEDIMAGQALYHDFTNAALIQRGYRVPPFTPEQAGEILAHLVNEFDLCLFEYFLTDRVGHAQDPSLARQEIQKIDRLLHTLLSRVALQETLILLASDHGNVEDLSVKTHTQNPAMLLAWGKGSSWIRETVRDLTHIAPTLIRLLKDNAHESARTENP